MQVCRPVAGTSTLNPYPSQWVWVCWGKDTGSSGIPQGYPLQSLPSNNMAVGSAFRNVIMGWKHNIAGGGTFHNVIVVG